MVKPGDCSPSRKVVSKILIGAGQMGDGALRATSLEWGSPWLELVT
jgi:hypothetical protein